MTLYITVNHTYSIETYVSHWQCFIIRRVICGKLRTTSVKLSLSHSLIKLKSALHLSYSKLFGSEYIYSLGLQFSLFHALYVLA